MQATPRDISSERDRNQTFSCTAMGGPDNTFTWMRLSDSMVVGQVSSLTITVDNADKGSDYRCTVCNVAGNESIDVTMRGLC